MSPLRAFIALVPLLASANAPLVAVDPGHTAASPGAVGARGTREHDLNVAVAQRLVSALRARGLRAVLLGDGRDLPNDERAVLAGALGAAALISIHQDSVQPRYLQRWNVGGQEREFSDRARGFSLFFSGTGGRPAESRALAEALGTALVRHGYLPTLHHAEQIPGEGRELLDPAHGVYRFDGLIVLREATMPAVLVECGVLVNRREELELASPDRQERFARVLAEALRDALEAHPSPGAREGR